MDSEFTAICAERVMRQSYGLAGKASALPGEFDSNFCLDASDGRRYLLRASCPTEQQSFVEFQNAMIRRLALTAARSYVQSLVPNAEGQEITRDGGRIVRVFSWIDGRPLAQVKPHTDNLLQDVGRILGLTDHGLAGFACAAARRDLKWDLSNALWICDHLALIRDPALRKLLDLYIGRHPSNSLSKLRRAVIHNDANDSNVLVSGTGYDARVCALIDFGDALEAPLVCNVAIACAYAMCGKEDPVQAAVNVVSGYHSIFPLTEPEVELIYPLACMRLCVSVVNSALMKLENPHDPYVTVSESPAWEALQRLAGENPLRVHSYLRAVCGGESVPAAGKSDLISRRRESIGGNVSLSYREPLEIVRGQGQYLFDSQGRKYLDAYNNVPHVGHCHPRVVEAATRQMATLNTNTRYLHEGLVRYAERLRARLPKSLSVVFLVASGSEATELSLRLAHAHTRAKDVIVSDGAYHGHTSTLIDISPYKAEGPGGEGLPEWVHKAPLPDVFRGKHRAIDSQAGQKYAGDVCDIIERLRASGQRLRGFLIESIPSVGGQIVLPGSYLSLVYQAVRAAGGVCIADEVQTGFGRIGTHFWAFEPYGVTPDIVALGKPIGNGYPMGAVVTTAEIAKSFDNGMEFFSTFGGSTVACAVGNAVLDVLETENLQENARAVGHHLLAGFRQLAEKHSVIGDVRGSGLMLGVELVESRATLKPAAKQASYIVDRMKELGVLWGTDGIYHNVLKLRGPLCMTRADADNLISAFAEVLSEDAAQ